jgi:hypothetical protein
LLYLEYNSAPVTLICEDFAIRPIATAFDLFEDLMDVTYENSQVHHSVVSCFFYFLSPVPVWKPTCPSHCALSRLLVTLNHMIFHEVAVGVKQWNRTVEAVVPNLFGT